MPLEAPVMRTDGVDVSLTRIGSRTAAAPEPRLNWCRFDYQTDNARGDASRVSSPIELTNPAFGSGTLRGRHDRVFPRVTIRPGGDRT
jgi:hypothetical protein